MICPECQTDVPGPRAFCPRCATRLPRPLAECLEESRPAAPARDRERPPATGAHDGPSAAFFRAGDLVAERFRLVREIGRGQLGVVYEAVDTVGGEGVALRALYAALCARADVRAAYREALADWRTREGERVVQVLARGEQGVEYHVMELVDAPSLAARISEIASTGRPLPYRDLYPLVAGLAKALDHGRRPRGHRGLTPANIFVPSFDRPRVADFGLAACLRADERAEAAERTDTARYLAPELFHASSAAGAAADVWALGAIAYELATAKRPKGSADGWPRPSALRPDLPEAFDGLFACAVRLDPAGRPRTADAFAFELARALRAPEPDKAPPRAARTTAPAPATPGRADTPTRRLDETGAAAREAFERGELREAADLASQALDAHPEDAELELLAVRAETALKERTDQRSKLLQVHRDRAREHEQAGDWEGAADHLRRLIALDPPADERERAEARLETLAAAGTSTRRSRAPALVWGAAGLVVAAAAAVTLYYWLGLR